MFMWCTLAAIGIYLFYFGCRVHFYGFYEDERGDGAYDGGSVYNALQP